MPRKMARTPGSTVVRTAAPAEAPSPVPAATKTTMVLNLLRRADGATLSDIIEVTGWLPHSTRAALTGLRM